MKRLGLLLLGAALAGEPCALGQPASLTETPDGGTESTREVDRDGAARLSRKALARIKDGAWDDAADLLRRAHDKDARNAAIATDYGFALAHLGRREEAERLYRAAIEQEPGRFYAYANLAELWAADPMRWQRRDETVAFLEKALATLVDGRAQASVELRLAELLRSLGRTADARTRLQHLTGATVPSQVRRRALDLLAAVDAEAHERALEDWPLPAIADDDRQRLDRARVTADERAALASIDDLLARQPAWVDARWERARVLEHLGQLDEASADLTIVVQLCPSHAQAWRRLGSILAQHGGGFEAERADEALRHALALEPSWSDLRELRRQVAAKRARGTRKVGGQRIAEPTAKARQLFQDAQSWMGMEAPEMAPPLLQQALAESPGFVEAAAALYAIEHAVPETTVKALWNDGQGLWQLALATGALRSREAAVQAGPWIDRAVDLGVEEARFGRASLRAAAGDRARALADLRDYVAAEATPPRLEEARALRTTLLAAAGPGSPERFVHLKLADDHPAEALGALGGPCRPGLPFDNLLALGKVYEFTGDARTALACYRRALDLGPALSAESVHRAWTRLAAAASTLPAVELGPFESQLEAAAQAKVGLAAFSLARMAEARRQWSVAVTNVRTFLAQADRDDPRLGEARALQARMDHVVEKETEERNLRVQRLRLGTVVVALTVLALLALRRWNRKSLARALRSQPLLFPAIAKSIGRIRHDVLKHRTSALELLGDRDPPRDEIARALLDPAPTSNDVASIYDQLAQEARGLGVRLCRMDREPVLGALVADLKKAETSIQRPTQTDDGLSVLRAIDERLRGLHSDRLQGLLRSGPRTTLNAELLARWIDGVCRAHASTLTPGLYLQGAQIPFPLPKATLASIVSNLLRNAVAASEDTSPAAVEVRAERGRDGTGRRTVSLVVADTSPQKLDAETIERRPADRGLGIVRETVRAWGGDIVVREEAAPFRKSVGVRFAAPPEASP
jgi:tetratricopeptide (TPR) repeat protein